jgi:16S rRNA (cytosine1402-N4)-methyltransferase
LSHHRPFGSHDEPTGSFRAANASSDPVHEPVMPQEVLDFGNPVEGEHWIDGTAGAGGHSRLISQRIGPEGRLLALDRDPATMAYLRRVLPANSQVEQGSYDEIPTLLASMNWPKVDGVLLDLGLSSDQLADRERGFSFQSSGRLDMRFDPTSGQPVSEWLRHVDEKTLADAIFLFGEERFSRRIARAIVQQRKTRPIETAEQLREIIYRCIPGARRTSSGKQRHGRVDPATRTFQALRIAINEELSILERALQCIPDCLAPGGRLLIISFHSLEDRLVKQAFRADPRLEVVTKKPIRATTEESAQNPRSRSAKLRVAKAAMIARA